MAQLITSFPFLVINWHIRHRKGKERPLPAGFSVRLTLSLPLPLSASLLLVFQDISFLYNWNKKRKHLEKASVLKGLPSFVTHLVLLASSHCSSKLCILSIMHKNFFNSKPGVVTYSPLLRRLRQDKATVWVQLGICLKFQISLKYYVKSYLNK